MNSQKIMKRYIIAAVLLILLIGGFGVYYYEGQLPVNSQDTESRTFVIKKGEAVNSIINNLAKEDLIRNKLAFYLLIKQMKIENEIQAGLFRLSPSMSAKDIANSLTQGSDDIWITIIEGLRKEEIAQIVSIELGIPESEFIKEAEEGKLFPDTYLIPRTATAEQVLQVFENNYNAKFTPELQEQARARGLSEKQVLIFASMLEREANSADAMQNVANILMKRWENDWPLQIDATVQYALGYQADTGTWWKQDLTFEDLKINSAYNTYENIGLPPGPIASPGIVAIQAVINADSSTPYWYYISNAEGSELHFARTLEEHNENIKKYLR